MRTVSRYVVREIGSNFNGVLLLVVVIFAVRRLASLLDDAGDAALPLVSLLHLLLLRTAMALPSLVPAVLYVSVLLGLGRLYRDSEMAALAACGVPPHRIGRMVAGLALVAAVGVGAMSGWIRPYAAARYQTLQGEIARGLDLDSVTPGRFYDFGGDGEQVLFAEGRVPDNPQLLAHVFVQQREGEWIGIMYANRALEHRDVAGGYRFLRLMDGVRYDLRADGRGYEVTEYDELVIRTTLTPALAPQPEESARSTGALLASGDLRDQAELQWRLAMPISALILMLLAIPLSRADPRAARYANLIIALPVYLLYRQLLAVAKDWAMGGVANPVFLFLAVHAACLMLTVVLFFVEPDWGRRVSDRGRALLARWRPARAA